MRGVVLYAQTETCSDVSSRTAASGATVRLECSGEAVTEVVTVMGGRFRLDPHRLGDDCAIVVDKAGYRTRRYPVPELCVDPMTSGSSCEAASLTAHLVPLPVEPEEEAP